MGHHAKFEKRWNRGHYPCSSEILWLHVAGVYAHNMNKIEHWLQGVKHMGISIRVSGTDGWVERGSSHSQRLFYSLYCVSHCLNLLNLNPSMLVLDPFLWNNLNFSYRCVFPAWTYNSSSAPLERCQSSTGVFVLSLAFIGICQAMTACIHPSLSQLGGIPWRMQDSLSHALSERKTWN